MGDSTAFLDNLFECFAILPEIVQKKEKKKSCPTWAFQVVFNGCFPLLYCLELERRFWHLVLCNCPSKSCGQILHCSLISSSPDWWIWTPCPVQERLRKTGVSPVESYQNMCRAEAHYLAPDHMAYKERQKGLRWFLPKQARLRGFLIASFRYPAVQRKQSEIHLSSEMMIDTSCSKRHSS